MVDDSVTAREELRAALERGGLDVRHRGVRGEEGLRVAAERRPGAVVVDGVMPGMDGAAFIRALRVGRRRCAPRRASSSPRPARWASWRALDAGADAFVRKDVDGRRRWCSPACRQLLRSAPPALEAPAAARSRRSGSSPSAEASPARRRCSSGCARDGHDVVRATTVGRGARAARAWTSVDALLVERPGRSTRRPRRAARLRADAGVARRRRSSSSARRDDQDAILRAMEAGADDYVAGGERTGGGRAPAWARSSGGAPARARAPHARGLRRAARQILETISDAFFAVDRELAVRVREPRARASSRGGLAQRLAGELLWEHCRWLAADAGPGGAGARGESGTCRSRSRRGGRTSAGTRCARSRTPIGLSAYLRDVTDRRHSQEVQAHLLGMVGHDLRTPLTAVGASVGARPARRGAVPAAPAPARARGQRRGSDGAAHQRPARLLPGAPRRTASPSRRATPTST